MVQLYTAIIHVLIYSSSLSSIMCLNQTMNQGGLTEQGYRRLNHHSSNNKPALQADSPRLPIKNKPLLPKKTLNPATKLLDQNGALKNISALPTKGVFDHTNRPGTVVWKTPIYKPPQAESSKEVVALGPVYRLPVDHDDTGSQIRMEWSYAHLKVRPENVTLEAVGPNKAVWTITVMEGTKTTAIWDLRETPSYSPLIEGFYNLQIYDQRGKDTLPKPGWLLPDKKMRIALYKTEGENHVGEYIAPSECATCYKHVMQGLGKLENSSNTDKNNHIHFNLIIGTISCFGWWFF